MTTINICGMNNTDNGRACVNHINGCGYFVQLNDAVSFKECTFVDQHSNSLRYHHFDHIGKSECAVSVHSIQTGCKIGFVQKKFFEVIQNWEQQTGTITKLNPGYKYGWGQIRMK